MSRQSHEASGGQVSADQLEQIQNIYQDLTTEECCAAVANSTSMGLLIRAVLAAKNEGSVVPHAISRPREIQAERAEMAARQEALQAAA